jgi:hypothetical protein
LERIFIFHDDGLVQGFLIKSVNLKRWLLDFEFLLALLVGTINLVEFREASENRTNLIITGTHFS